MLKFEIYLYHTMAHIATQPTDTKPTMHEDGPGAAVAATVELCEQILNYLPAIDILRAQYVSKAYAGTVAGSSILQRRLFRQSDLKPSTTKWTISRKEMKIATHGPSSSKHSGSFNTRTVRTVIINPLLFRQHGFQPRPKAREWPTTLPEYFGIRSCLMQVASRGLHLDASCRGMLLTKPMAREIHIICRGRNSTTRQRRSERFTIRNDGGLTFNDLLGALIGRKWEVHEVTHLKLDYTIPVMAEQKEFVERIGHIKVEDEAWQELKAMWPMGKVDYPPSNPTRDRLLPSSERQRARTNSDI